MVVHDGELRVRGLLVVAALCASIAACRTSTAAKADAGGAGQIGVDAAPAVSCAAAADCASGFCSDGVCCDQACTGTCQACARAATGVPDGVCAPVMLGMDLHDDCAAETSACGHDGECDGKGACGLAPRGRQCRPAACSDSHTFQAAGLCDGSGVCVPGSQTSCQAQLCDDVSGCAKPCTDDAACPNGSTCISGTCQPRRVNGQACAANSDCTSGFCSPEQICCDTACTGLCTACAMAATGQPDGTCAPVRAGIDPREDCPKDNPATCGRNGSCDGAGACDLYGGGTICEAARCDAGGQFFAARTCAAGTCVPTTQEACGLAVCDADTGCRRSCTGDGDCIAHSFCATGGICMPQRANGAACAAGHDCLSGYCVDGVCCDNACTGLCVSCRGSETGRQTDGACADVVDGTDPENECTPGATACGLDGFCGQGRCRLAPATTTCAAARCVNATGNTSATFTPAAKCDAQGACTPATSRACAGSVTCLSSEECRPSTCSADADCLGGFYCAAGTCTARKTVGGTCSASNQCTSGFCGDTSHGDAVCCATACALACQGCTKATTGVTDGTCGPRLANATAVCGGACAPGYGLCSSGLSCQPTAWTFDGEPMDSNAMPFGWGPDDMSAVQSSMTWNHTPGGNGSLKVLAGTPWDAAPSVVLCAQDPDISNNSNAPSIDISGKTVAAWLLFDGAPTSGTCQFVFDHPNGDWDEIRGVSFLPTQASRVWREMKTTISITEAPVRRLKIRCTIAIDSWTGNVFIDDVSIR